MLHKKSFEFEVNGAIIIMMSRSNGDFRASRSTWDSLLDFLEDKM